MTQLEHLEELRQSIRKSLAEAKDEAMQSYWHGFLDGTEETIRRIKKESKLATTPPQAEGVISEQ